MASDVKNPAERSVSPQEALERTARLRGARPVPVTYQHEIKRLERRVAQLEARNAELVERNAVMHQRVRAVRDVRLKGRLKTDPRYRVRCEECGAEPFHLCRAPSNNRLRLPHHMRGRDAPCGRPMGCKVCAAAFGQVAIDASRNTREASDDG